MTEDGSAWVLELRPRSVKEFMGKLVIHAIPTPKEDIFNRGQIRRKLILQSAILRGNASKAAKEAALRGIQIETGSSVQRFVTEI